MTTARPIDPSHTEVEVRAESGALRVAAFAKGARDTLGIHIEPYEVGSEIPQTPPPDPWHFDHKPIDPRQPRGSSDFKENQWPSAK